MQGAVCAILDCVSLPVQDLVAEAVTHSLTLPILALDCDGWLRDTLCPSRRVLVLGRYGLLKRIDVDGP